MILTDYYKGENITKASTRFDITASVGSYELFETLLINKRKFNVDGLSFNCVRRPEAWKGDNIDQAITKGNSNITSIKQPDLTSNIGFGDINTTNDACVIVFNPDFKEVGVKALEVFIARGYKSMEKNLYEQFVSGELDAEAEHLRKTAAKRLLL